MKFTRHKTYDRTSLTSNNTLVIIVSVSMATQMQDDVGLNIAASQSVAKLLFFFWK